MFSTGEYVVCGNKGVCVVEQVTRLSLSGVDWEREYYILKPLYLSGSTVYVPVDSPRESMRRVTSRREAEELIEALPELPLIEITNEKLAEQIYREYMRTSRCEDWARIIKTIYRRKQKRIQDGRKITAVDARYSRMAEESLYGELAVALEQNRDEVEESIIKCFTFEKKVL